MSRASSEAIVEEQQIIKRRSFWRKHRKLLLILGMAFLTAAIIAIIAVSCAPALAAMPAFLYMSMKLSVALGIALNSKILVGAIFAISAVVVAGITAGVTAGVLAIVKYFKNHRTTKDGSSADLVEEQSLAPQVLNNPAVKQDNNPFVRAKGTPGGLKRFGRFATKVIVEEESEIESDIAPSFKR